MTESVPRFHLAMPVDDLAAAAEFYGSVIGCERGRSSDTWIDWNLHGHQFVTHLAPGRSQGIHNPVDGHDVPVPPQPVQQVAEQARGVGRQSIKRGLIGDRTPKLW